MSLKLSILICVVAILSLVIPATADNNTATVHGEVYSLDTFEPLDNAVIYVDSTPSQSMVAKYGMYSFELEPGNYTITAKYYQNSTVTYEVDETVNIKNNGTYVRDLLLLPVYSEELMSSSEINGSLNNSTLSVENPALEPTVSNINGSKDKTTASSSGFYSQPLNYLFIGFLSLILLSATGYHFSRKQKKLRSAFKTEKIAYTSKDLSRPVNSLEPSVRVSDKNSNHEPKKVKAYTEVFESIEGQVVKPKPESSIIEQGTEEKYNSLETKEKIEGRKESLTQEIDHEELKQEFEASEDFPEKLADRPEIKALDPKKKLPLPADLQNVMDIIRGQGGRMTQKDLCIRLKCSDAKVSLMLADLERRELIDKFKKGRGNIVILKDEEQ